MDFEASVADFFLPHDVYFLTREDMVLPMVRWLLNEGVVSIVDRGYPLRAMCWLVVMPKTKRKVSPISNFGGL